MSSLITSASASGSAKHVVVFTKGCQHFGDNRDAPRRLSRHTRKAKGKLQKAKSKNESESPASRRLHLCLLPFEVCLLPSPSANLGLARALACGGPARQRQKPCSSSDTRRGARPRPATWRRTTTAT